MDGVFLVFGRNVNDAANDTQYDMSILLLLRLLACLISHVSGEYIIIILSAYDAIQRTNRHSSGTLRSPSRLPILSHGYFSQNFIRREPDSVEAPFAEVRYRADV